MHKLCGIVLFAGIFLISGCGGNGRKAVYPAKGRVVDAAGQPLAGALVVLHPADKLDDNAHKPAARAADDGSFALTTYVENDGAPNLLGT